MNVFYFQIFLEQSHSFKLALSFFVPLCGIASWLPSAGALPTSLSRPSSLYFGTLELAERWKPPSLSSILRHSALALDRTGPGNSWAWRLISYVWIIRKFCLSKVLTGPCGTAFEIIDDHSVTPELFLFFFFRLNLHSSFNHYVGTIFPCFVVKYNMCKEVYPEHIGPAWLVSIKWTPTDG